MFAAVGARVPEVITFLMGHERSRNLENLDLERLFPGGVPEEAHQLCRENLRGWHVVVSVGARSTALVDKDSVAAYRYLTTELRETTVLNRALRPE